MNEASKNGLLSEKMKILSGSSLKLIAVITMLIDHIGAFMLVDYEPALKIYFYIGENPISIYWSMRYIGRISFPIFAFLLTEGFAYTKSRKKYGLSLLLFAFLSELPYNLINADTWHYKNQNIFFTLFLGYLGMCAIEYFSDNIKKQTVSLVILFLISIFLNADYGTVGFGFIILIYALRDKKLLQAIIGSSLMPYTYITGIAFIPINLYNGKRGFINGIISKYAFYYFYPVHLLILCILKRIIFK